MKPYPAGAAKRAGHVPTRSCAACGAKKAPIELLRIASKEGATPELVTNKRAPGRSAYLCCDRKCVDRAFARRALERSLRLKNSVPQEVREQLLRAIGSRDAAE